MSTTLAIMLMLVLTGPIVARFVDQKWRIAIAALTALMGLYICLAVGGVMGRAVIGASGLEGDELNTFAKGVVALQDRTWAIRVLTGAVIVALFLLLLSPRSKDR